jgi:hypothetical protein
MRFAILTGTRHGETLPVVIADATHPVEEQKRAFKDFARSRQSAQFAEVQLWTSTACIIARRRLKPPEPATDAEKPKKPKATR